MTSRNDKAKRWQFGIRGLIMLTLAVGLALAWHQERVRRQEAVQRLENVLTTSHVWLWSPSPVEQYLLGVGSIGVAGELYVSGATGVLSQPVVRLQLLRENGGDVITEIDANVSEAGFGKYEFGGTFRLDAKQTPPVGLCVVRADCFDGDALVATGVRVMDIVGLP